MRHLWFIGYCDVEYWNIVPLDLDIKTSVNIWPMIFRFVYSSIHYTPIIKSFPKALWCGIWFTIAILHVVHCISTRKCGAHDLQLTGSNLFPHTVSASVFFFFSFFFSSYLPDGCFYAFKIKYINLGQPTLHRLYPYMTPQTHKIIIIEGHLISNSRP